MIEIISTYVYEKEFIRTKYLVNPTYICGVYIADSYMNEGGKALYISYVYGEYVIHFFKDEEYKANVYYKFLKGDFTEADLINKLSRGD